MSKLKEAFTNSRHYITVFTVGELINELKRLPSDLRIDHQGDEGVCVVVFNVDTDPCLGFDEPYFCEELEEESDEEEDLDDY